jgi:hypothetical protein
MKSFQTLGIAVVTTFALVGCRGPLLSHRSGLPRGIAGQAPTPTPTAPSTLPSDVLTLLQRYTLAQSNLPDGYSAGGIVEVPNQQAATDYADPQAALQEIAETGRQGGLGQQVFPPPSASGTIGVSIEIFKDPQGAQRWASQPPPLPDSLKPTSVDAGQVAGEASSVTHWTQGSQSGYVLSFSRGRIVYGIGIAAPTGQEVLDPLQTLARGLDQLAQQQSN